MMTKKNRRPRLKSAYDKATDAGTPVLTGEQARVLVLAVADALRSGRYDEIDRARMIAAVEALNHTFRLGIESA